MHVRLDDDSAAALALLRREAGSDSAAIRDALTETAARRRRRGELAVEVFALAGHSGDREEMAQIREEMARLAPPPPPDG